MDVLDRILNILRDIDTNKKWHTYDTLLDLKSPQTIKLSVPDGKYDEEWVVLNREEDQININTNSIERTFLIKKGKLS